jgi:hypothetical protein
MTLTMDEHAELEETARLARVYGWRKVRTLVDPQPGRVIFGVLAEYRGQPYELTVMVEREDFIGTALDHLAMCIRNPREEN